MSQGCNFINSWMSASRRRSASVTRPATGSASPSAKSSFDTSITTSDSRRASSSNDLVILTPQDQVSKIKSVSGNHLVASNETICPLDSTQVNARVSRQLLQAPPGQQNSTIQIPSIGQYVQHSELMRPIEIDTLNNDDIDDDRSDYIYPLENFQDCHLEQEFQTLIEAELSSESSEDSDIDLEEECRRLKEEGDILEKRVEEMERARFDSTVPRTLIENMIKQRRKLRDIECEIYKLSLPQDETSNNLLTLPSFKIENDFDLSDSSSFDNLSSNGDNFADDDNNEMDLCNSPQATTSKSGSFLRPGQENTADILDAIPPSGPLQYKQYFGRVSSVTDSSEYSQIPLFNQIHKHQLPPVRQHGHNRHHQQTHQRKSENQFISGKKGEEVVEVRNNRHHRNYSCPKIKNEICARFSPIRPNHFKDELNPIIPQDSSSTASSSSSPH